MKLHPSARVSPPQVDPRRLRAGTAWLGHGLRRPFKTRRGELSLSLVLSAALDAVMDGDTATWVVQGRLDGHSGTTIVPVGPNGSGGGLLKASDRPWGRRSLHHQMTVLADLHADSRLGPWRDRLPQVLAHGTVDDVFWVLESRLAGCDGRLSLNHPERGDRFVSSATAAIGELNRRTAASVPVGDDELDRWVRQPVATIRTALYGRDREALNRLEHDLVARLAGRPVTAGWTHGDYHPGNVLSGPDGSAGGIVDWCAAEPDGMVVLDTVGFLLAVEMSARRSALGAVVARQVRVDRANQLPSLVGRVQVASPDDGLDVRTLVLLAWLRHAAHFIATEPPGFLNPIWVSRNLRPVLRAWTGPREGGCAG